MRVACLLVPLFPLAARLRSEPGLASEAVVVTEGNGQAARVVAATRSARKAGVRPGMTLPQARALLPKLLARGRDPQVERSAQETLLEIAESFSPRVEDAQGGVVFLDIGSVRNARGTDSGGSLEHALAHTLATAAHKAALPARVGVASSKLVARLAASTRGTDFGGSPHPSASTRGTDFGGYGQPLAETARASSETSPSPRQGVGSPSPSASTRGTDFGGYGQPLAGTARASSETSPSPRQGVGYGQPLAGTARASSETSPSPRQGVGSPSAAHRARSTSIVCVPPGREAEFLSPLPIDRLSPELEVAVSLSRWGLRCIGDLVRLPAAEVTARLGSLGESLYAAACGRDPQPLLPRHPHETFSEGLDLEWPLAALEPFLALASSALERLLQRLASQALACSHLSLDLSLDPSGHDIRDHSLPAPTRDVRTLVTLLRLDLERRPPGAPVASFTLTVRPDRPRRRQLTLFGPADVSTDDLAPLLARLGSRAGSPGEGDGHDPSSFLVFPYDPPASPVQRRPLRPGRGLLAVRVLRPPRPLETLVSEAPYRLLSIRTTDQDAPVAGSVQIAAGPWRMEEDWWSSASVERAYWDVELAGGGLYRIYEDTRSSAWYLDGVYD